MEIWKSIKGYKGYYEISDYGNVRSLTRIIKHINSSRIIKGRILKSGIGTNGYKYVILSKNGIKKTKYIHRLIALEFIPKINGEREVDHIDENKLNNNVFNLRWVNRYYNASRSTKGKYRRRNANGENNPNAKKVYCIENNKIINIFNCAKYLSNELNMNYSTLRKRLQKDDLIIDNIKYSYNGIKINQEIF